MFLYLIWSLSFGIIWLILFIIKKNLRKEMLYISLLFAPFGLMQMLFVPDYWNPDVIYKFFGLFDIESVLHVFFLGGISAVLHESIFRYYHKTRKKGCNEICNTYVLYIIFGLLAVFLVLIKIFTEYSVLRASFIATSLILIYMLISRKDLRKHSIIGGLTFMIFYICSLFIMNFLFGFISEWTFSGTLGIFFFGLPVEEYFYAFFLGAIGSIVYEEFRQIKLVRKK